MRLHRLVLGGRRAAAGPLALAALALALAPEARAGFILQPTSATSHMGATFPAVPNNTRNQSGLRTPSGMATGYTTLVTDFDTFIASDPRHVAGGTTMWESRGTTTGDFDFALGGTFTIESFALWNTQGSPGIREFQLLADDNAAFSSPTLLGTFTTTVSSLSLQPAHVFTFTPTSAAFVRMSITSNHGHSAVTQFGEGAFEVSSGDPVVVPEPASLVLAASGAISLLVLLKARRTRTAGARRGVPARGEAAG